MAIKDDIKDVKRVVSSEEQFLESIIKGEYFFKKNKKLVLIILALVVIIPLVLATKDFFNDRKFQAANKAYSELILDPNNAKARENLKTTSPNLYALYEFRTALDNNDSAKIEELSNLQEIDPILRDVIGYQATGLSDGVMEGYTTFMKGYNYLKDGDIAAANSEFIKIPPNSPLAEVARNLRHYNGVKNEEK
ncbi:MAG: hypothetical protein GXZ15_04800 [Campylobacter sp.]|nr:hypothetical protein [Campylobacter sp.]